MKQKLKTWLACTVALAAVSSVVVWRVAAQSAPVLKVAQTSTNQIQITITNGVATNIYEVLWTPILADPNYPWTSLAAGSQGQTNFLVTFGATEAAFFRVQIGTDADGDGIPDWQDSRPNDASKGILTISIESPANGSTIN